jgi:hypothetical protein
MNDHQLDAYSGIGDQLGPESVISLGRNTQLDDERLKMKSYFSRPHALLAVLLVAAALGCCLALEPDYEVCYWVFRSYLKGARRTTTSTTRGRAA